jgi:hypothetical protein
MSNGTASTLATSLSSLFANLTPVQLGRLGHHLSNSDQMRALMLISNMQATPASAPMYVTALSVIPNLPPQVLTWVNAAIADPKNFASNMAQAQAALQQAAVAPGILGNLGL